MRTDILDLHDFYESPLGETARGFIKARIAERLTAAPGLRIAGYGHAEPYLDGFEGAERVLALAPGGQGVIHWPRGQKNRAALVENARWPLPDASIDRVVIVHGLEAVGDARRLMREVWRVLVNDGRVIVVAPHRRGIWSAVDTTPFAGGRPYLKRQLERLLAETMFAPTAWAGALYFPPFATRFLLRAANAWERVGGRVWSGLSGVVLVEAEKTMAAPVGAIAVQRARASAPAAARPALSRGGAPRT